MKSRRGGLDDGISALIRRGKEAIALCFPHEDKRRR
jgi:hypothetical protein